ncbi:Increased rDNA silencing protein [Metarhizium acridum]|uniref:Increased rDNA silencing protein n=1 Tax=Metarhizium acridum TaxID=92637 RepID=UPI001C6B1238|nr:Increased rDNA silencing protein [Metarhizium acridum]KAG8412025.1 Increased rDNA silencing protein [Metarhizium acridum]
MNPAAASHSGGSQDDAATALRGASLAFQRSPAVGATSPPHHGKDGASSSVGRSRSPLGVALDATGDGGSGAHGRHVDSPGYRAGVVAARLHQLNGSHAQLQPTTSAQRLDPKSPSFIAATLAASRSVSPSPMARTPRRKSSFGAASVLGNADAVDSESIAPAGNLISMFEAARDGTETTRKPARRRTPPPGEPEDATRGVDVPADRREPAPSPKTKSRHVRPPTPPQGADEARSSSMPPKQPPTPPHRSSEKISAMPMPKPKPPRELTSPPKPPPNPAKPQLPPPAGPKPGQAGMLPPPPRLAAKPAPKPLKVRLPSPPSVVSTSTPEVLSPKPVRLITPTLAPPVLSSPGAYDEADSSPSPDPDKRTQTTSLRPPKPPKPRGSQRLAASKSGSRSRRRGNSDTPLPRGSSSATPLTEFGLPIVSPPPPQQQQQQQQPIRHIRRKKTPPPLPARRRESVASAPTSPVRDAPRRRRPTNTSTTNLPLDPLTSAMMASSLASYRLTPHNTGSSLPPPSLPKRQKSPHLLQTLRQPQSHSDDDPERLKIAHRHKLSSNKHAHHEGSRKRWRDQITQRERKRYEAVWASNRGYLLNDDGPSQSVDSGLHRIAADCVANVVVREIWKRSRLPEDELVEVWELVDRGHAGMLTRQEFIVGMWLIDQRLRGRKLPVRVSDSVWDSANGVRISKPKTR